MMFIGLRGCFVSMKQIKMTTPINIEAKLREYHLIGNKERNPDFVQTRKSRKSGHTDGEALLSYGLRGVFIHGKTITIGFTEVVVDETPSHYVVSISHRGNMGARLADVDVNLEIITGLEATIKTLDELGPESIKEEGSPDYAWGKTWRFKK